MAVKPIPEGFRAAHAARSIAPTSGRCAADTSVAGVMLSAPTVAANAAAKCLLD